LKSKNPPFGFKGLVIYKYHLQGEIQKGGHDDDTANDLPFQNKNDK